MTGSGPRRGLPPAPPRDLVRKQAQLMVEIARARLGAAFDDLCDDPCRTLIGWDEIDLRLVPEPTATAFAAGSPNDSSVGCSVAGAYLESHDPTIPPIVQVAQSASPGRREFTALHELGHHLQRTDIDLAAVLWDQPALDAFEDMACDAFAANILLPDEAVDSVINTEGPTAGDVVALYERTRASRSAVCVRASQRLPAPGHVCLLDPVGEMFFAAASGMPPLGKGGDQSRVEVIARGLRTGNSRGRGRFFYRDGILGDELFIQTAAMDGYLVVVAVTDHAPWETTFVLPSRDVGPRARSYECADPTCGTTYFSYEKRCERCGVPPCTACGRCSCTPNVAEKTCTSCWLMKPAAFFDGDVCGDCA